MLLVPVASTDIAAMGYDPTLGELQVQFTTGRVYSYAAFPPEVYDAFVNAPSKGQYFALNIKSIYPSTRLL